MPFFIALGMVAVLLAVLFVAAGNEQGPQPGDVARAYETAWDRHDFEVLFDLSGPELRDGLTRDRYVAAKRAAQAAAPTRGLARAITVESVTSSGDSAVVVTRVEAADGALRNDVLLERRGGIWQVVGYSLRGEDTRPARS